MPLLRNAIYSTKRLIQKNKALYGFLFFLITANRDSLQRIIFKDRYFSKFGGLWTDRKILANPGASAALSEETQSYLRQWRKEGFVIIPGAISHTVIDQFNARLDSFPHSRPEGLRVTLPDSHEGVAYSPEIMQTHASARLVDLYFHFPEARQILFSESIVSFLKMVFNTAPLLTQSLSFEYGSEQPFHQDTSFVIMTSPMAMAAVWVALEDVRPGAGALKYYPGSHRWGDYLFSGRFKHWDRERDGEAALQDWEKWRHSQAEARGVAPVTFEARKGDILFWHAGLIHGGAKITDDSRTRRSLVAHYCPAHVRPLYHFYKPGQRRIYRDGAHRFTTAFYP